MDSLSDSFKDFFFIQSESEEVIDTICSGKIQQFFFFDYFNAFVFFLLFFPGAANDRNWEDYFMEFFLR